MTKKPLHDWKLAEMLQSTSELTVQRGLTKIRSTMTKQSRPHVPVNQNVFILIIKHLTSSNQEILNLSLSIAANNVCLSSAQRLVFADYGGIDHLIALLKRLHWRIMYGKKEQPSSKGDNPPPSSNVSKTNDQLICRAWRLAANLAVSAKLCMNLLKRGLVVLIHEYMALTELFGPDTCEMFFRLIRKCWTHQFARRMISTKELNKAQQVCLQSTNQDIVHNSLNSLLFMAACMGRLADKDMFVRLASLHKRENASHADKILTIKVMASLLCYCSNLNMVEGTGVTDIIVHHVKEQQPPEKVVLKSLCVICREGAVRNLIKTFEMLPRLISLCSDDKFIKPELCISTLLLFQYDHQSIQVMANMKDFVTFLVHHSELCSSIELLMVFARLPQPIAALVDMSLIDTLLKEPLSRPLLHLIGRRSEYFETLILSGKVWALYDAGCCLSEVGSTGHGEGVIAHHLGSKTTPARRRTVALALPFLLSSEHKKLILKLFGQCNGLSEILKALNETPTEASVIATIVMLSQLLPSQHFPEKNIPTATSQTACGDYISQVKENEDDEKMVIFELDCGKRVLAPRTLLCSRSIVINAMLTGHFSEAGKDVVKLSKCSFKALSTLVSVISNNVDVAGLSIDITTHLELISLTDRLLLEDLALELTNSLIPLSSKNCSAVYLWSLNAGHSVYASHLRAEAYSVILSNREALNVAVQCPNTRPHLIEDISGLFTDNLLSLNDYPS